MTVGTSSYVKKFAVFGLILAVVNNLVFNNTQATSIIDRLANTTLSIIIYSLIFGLIGFVWGKIKSR